jgi:hypothetical protein
VRLMSVLTNIRKQLVLGTLTQEHHVAGWPSRSPRGMIGGVQGRQRLSSRARTQKTR